MHASMGPRSTDRGIVVIETSAPFEIVLQWGRDQLIAELYNRWYDAVTGFWLQWGRDQLIAELSLMSAPPCSAPRFNGAAIN